MQNIAHAIMKAASAAGYTFAVVSEGETDYQGSSLPKAWEAVNAVEECGVTIFTADGSRLGSLYVIPGLDPEETVADYGDAGEFTWISRTWKQVFNANERAA